jgi:hypothetical protein
MHRNQNTHECSSVLAWALTRTASEGTQNFPLFFFDVFLLSLQLQLWLLFLSWLAPICQVLIPFQSCIMEGWCAVKFFIVVPHLGVSVPLHPFQPSIHHNTNESTQHVPLRQKKSHEEEETSEDA